VYIYGRIIIKPKSQTNGKYINMTEGTTQLDKEILIEKLSEIKGYSETYFYACFSELFKIEGGWESNLEGNEIIKIADFLNINIDKNELIEMRNSNSETIHLYHSKLDRLTFIQFDIRKDPTDQNDMFFLGVSYRVEFEKEINEMLLKLHSQLLTTSPFKVCNPAQKLINEMSVITNPVDNKYYRHKTLEL
jgi:hypothetical protein